MKMGYRRVLIVICGALMASAPLAAGAAEWPTRPIRLLVGFAPGGGTDTTARAIGTKLTAALGQQVIVDNRPGASGTIAADITANATPDGFTVLLGTIALVINPSLYQGSAEPVTSPWNFSTSRPAPRSCTWRTKAADPP